MNNTFYLLKTSIINLGDIHINYKSIKSIKSQSLHILYKINEFQYQIKIRKGLLHFEMKQFI